MIDGYLVTCLHAPSGHPSRRSVACKPRSTFGRFGRLAMIAMMLGFGLADAGGGQFNAVLSIGDAAPRWTPLEAADGNQYGWNDLSQAKCVVVAFTCNSCPYARDVEDRLIALKKAFTAEELSLVAINVNLVNDDLLPAMKQRATEKGFPFPYLHDPSQKVARDYGAIKTPEFFVIDSNGKIVYMGALDDSPDGKAVSKRYVADAITAVLAGTKPQTTETVPIGCRVRYSGARGGR